MKIDILAYIILMPKVSPSPLQSARPYSCTMAHTIPPTHICKESSLPTPKTDRVYSKLVGGMVNPTIIGIDKGIATRIFVGKLQNEPRHIGDIMDFCQSSTAIYGYEIKLSSKTGCTQFSQPPSRMVTMIRFASYFPFHIHVFNVHSYSLSYCTYDGGTYLYI